MIEESIIDSPLADEPVRFGVGYSLRYSVARIHFNNMITFRTCGGVETQTTLSYDSATGKYELNVDINAFEELVYTEPSFQIYRVVNGTDQLVASVSGQQRSAKNNVIRFAYNNYNGFVGKWAETIDGMYKFIEGGAGAAKFVDGDLVVYDFDVDLRPEGSTLAYRIDLQMRGGVDCPESANFAAKIEMDADGDGKIDFVPADVYESFLEELDVETPEEAARRRALHSLVFGMNSD